MAKQGKLFTGPTLDPQVAQAADRFLDLRREKKRNAELLEVNERRLIGYLKKMKKTRIKHKGVTLEFAHSEKDRIQVKGEPKDTAAAPKKAAKRRWPSKAK